MATRVAPAARRLYRQRLAGRSRDDVCRRAGGGTASEPLALRASHFVSPSPRKKTRGEGLSIGKMLWCGYAALYY